MVALNEIVFCNITCKVMDLKKRKMITHIFNKQVYKNVGKNKFSNFKALSKVKITEHLPIFEIEILARLGYANKNIWVK